jgi:methyltransferase-like protein
LKTEIESLRRRSDSYSLHEYLAPLNQPLYFHEFAALASDHGLQYLAEADLGMAASDGVTANLEPIVQRLAGDLIEWEQYQDFLRNRSFRQTLLCRNELAIDRGGVIDRVAGLHVATSLRPEAGASLDTEQPVKFTGIAGSLGTSAPVLKTALAVLSERWPEAMPFEKLTAEVQQRLYPDAAGTTLADPDSRSLMASLFDCHARRFAELHFAPPPCTAVVGETPRASALARHQATGGRTVTNLLHGVVLLNDLQRQLVSLADGTRNQAAMVEALAATVAKGELTVQADGGALQEPESVKNVLAEAVRWNLDLLAREALFLP